MPQPVITTGSGDLRERVAFDRQAIQSDGFGNNQGSWDEQFVVAARIKPARGGESIQAARLSGREPVLITVRSSSDTRQIRTEWRARDARSGKIYNVRSIVNPDERGAFLDLECEAGVAV